jgi:hypothetical protein
MVHEVTGSRAPVWEQLKKRLGQSPSRANVKIDGHCSTIKYDYPAIKRHGGSEQRYDV